MNKYLISIILLNLLLSVIPVHAEIIDKNSEIVILGNLPFHTSLDNRLKEANKENKTVLIFFRAEWDSYGKKFEAETLSNPEVNKILTDDFTLITIDLDKNKDEAEKFGVKYPPYFLFLNKNGDVLERLAGSMPSENFLAKIHEILTVTGTQPIINHNSIKISDLLSDPARFSNANIEVSGNVVEVLKTQTETLPITYTAFIRFDDGTGSIWAGTQAAEPISITQGSTISAKGFLMANFKSSSLNRTLNLVIFSTPDELTILAATPIQTSNQIQEDKKIKEIQERLNQTEAKQAQQEKRLSWLEEKMNAIVKWLSSIVGS
ncbi:Thiol:disulfide interchange protein DsbD [uncultured archaeon]|nr:Thiol:disulfide interchange protein DsbD [uncultured archaeon]